MLSVIQQWEKKTDNGLEKGQTYCPVTYNPCDKHHHAAILGYGI